MKRRTFLQIAAGAATVPVLRRAARAQAYPTRPVHIVVGFPAGGATDVVARLIGQSLSEQLGQQFIIENRPGAGTNIATEAVVRSSADGHTLLMAGSTNAVNAMLYEKLNFNFIRDIAPVASIGGSPFVVVATPSIPAKSISEFISYAKANPGKINMASPGVGSTSHVMGELFQMMTGIDLVHVPYRGSFMPDLLGGQVQVAFAAIPTVIEYARTRKLRAFAVTSAMRWNALPDIPTVGEFVAGYEASGWVGIGAPKNTSTAIIDKLNKGINVVIADPQVKAHLIDLGVEPIPMTPVGFGKFIGEETEKWGKVVKFANIKPE